MKIPIFWVNRKAWAKLYKAERDRKNLESDLVRTGRLSGSAGYRPKRNSDKIALA